MTIFIIIYYFLNPVNNNIFKENKKESCLKTTLELHYLFSFTQPYNAIKNVLILDTLQFNNDLCELPRRKTASHDLADDFVQMVQLRVGVGVVDEGRPSAHTGGYPQENHLLAQVRARL